MCREEADLPRERAQRWLCPFAENVSPLRERCAFESARESRGRFEQLPPLCVCFQPKKLSPPPEPIFSVNNITHEHHSHEHHRERETGAVLFSFLFSPPREREKERENLVR